MVALEVASEFAWVILTLVVMNIEVMFFGGYAGSLRSKKKIPYPKMTGDDEFERAQRVHYNALEGMPLIMTVVLLCGIWWPILGAAAGWIWIVGRFLYAKGYWAAPEKRVVGAMIFHIGELVGLVGTIAFAVQLLRQ